jgi:hypothetical protein
MTPLTVITSLTPWKMSYDFTPSAAKLTPMLKMGMKIR